MNKPGRILDFYTKRRDKNLEKSSRKAETLVNQPLEQKEVK
jgi:hypothetical protein